MPDSAEVIVKVMPDPSFVLRLVSHEIGVVIAFSVKVIHLDLREVLKSAEPAPYLLPNVVEKSGAQGR